MREHTFRTTFRVVAGFILNTRDYCVSDLFMWKIENQIQTDHFGEYCTLHTSIKVPGGIIELRQRIHDSPQGYNEGQQRAELIISSVNETLKANGATT